MKKVASYLFLFFSIGFIAASCGNKNKSHAERQTRTSGHATIVVDENLAPIINEQKQVYEGLHPEAVITPVYTGESNAYNLFAQDSIKTLVGTRPLNNNERAQLRDQKRTLRMKELAIDGVALIVNKANSDTLMKLETVKKIMLGEITEWKQIDPKSELGNITVVFDRPNSSTARFISDSVTNTIQFAPNIHAIADDYSKSDSLKLSPSDQILNYVMDNKNALGVLGVNWISNPRDTTNTSFDSRINVVSISNPKIDNSKYYKPYAAFLGLRWYPLSRIVYSMITDRNDGVASGFTHFSVGENGQRIINKSGLYPATVPTRLVRVDSKFDEK